MFFIDEIHRLLPDVEEMLYAALEDFRVDILVGAGPGARTHSLPVPRFTAIGATTRQGLLSAPLRGRFGLVLRLNHYTWDELATIVKRSARLLDVPIDERGAEEIARRSRGTPRIANRLLRRVRDYAQVRAGGRITEQVAQTALDLLEVDRFGLDEIDQKIMLTILDKYAGGPVGLNTIAASIDEEADYDRGSLRALPDPARVHRPHAARARRDGPRVRALRRRAQAARPAPEHAVLKLVYLSIGSNLGDREAALREAVAALGPAGVRVLRVSSVYETEPVDVPGQPWFLNIAVEAETDLFAKQLLARTQSIEREMGRVRTRPKGPRTIDIDILLYGTAVIESPDLTIPHPRMANRRFVLEPLAELAPDLRHPVTGITVREMLAEVQEQVVKSRTRQTDC